MCKISECTETRLRVALPFIGFPHSLCNFGRACLQSSARRLKLRPTLTCYSAFTIVTPMQIHFQIYDFPSAKPKAENNYIASHYRRFSQRLPLASRPQSFPPAENSVHVDSMLQECGHSWAESHGPEKDSEIFLFPLAWRVYALGGLAYENHAPPQYSNTILLWPITNLQLAITLIHSPKR